MKHHGFVVVLLLLLVPACSDSSDPVIDPAPTTIAPGQTIPLDSTVRIDTSAVYPLAAGGSTLTTVCSGRVDVIIELMPGMPVTNTCNAPTGTSQQTNPVGGVASVEYVLDPAARADVTLNP